MNNEDRCVMCGAIIPEGRMVCPTCEKNAERIKEKTADTFKEVKEELRTE